MINYPERDPVMPGIQGVFRRPAELDPNALWAKKFIKNEIDFMKKNIFKYFFTKFMAISRIFFLKRKVDFNLLAQQVNYSFFPCFSS